MPSPGDIMLFLGFFFIAVSIVASVVAAFTIKTPWQRYMELVRETEEKFEKKLWTKLV